MAKNTDIRDIETRLLEDVNKDWIKIVIKQTLKDLSSMVKYERLKTSSQRQRIWSSIESGLCLEENPKLSSLSLAWGLRSQDNFFYVLPAMLMDLPIPTPPTNQ